MDISIYRTVQTVLCVLHFSLHGVLLTTERTDILSNSTAPTTEAAFELFEPHNLYVTSAFRKLNKFEYLVLNRQSYVHLLNLIRRELESLLLQVMKNTTSLNRCQRQPESALWRSSLP
jgi:hypothetical protein